MSHLSVVTEPDAIRAHIQEVSTNKRKWAEGPWQDEPDRLEFKYKGYDCLVIRNAHAGNLCGYVAVTPDHPDFGKHHDVMDVSVHGGLTYSGECEGFICHRTEKPDDKAYWFGFDCAHGNDLRPGWLHVSEIQKVEESLRKMFPRHLREETYKNMDYVTREIRNLVCQLKEREACATRN